jgi:uncharacterized protein YdhG (YjbR/CyaY superfamily)
MSGDIAQYHDTLTESDRNICEGLHLVIQEILLDAESKVWHQHPVWFLQGNPIVGYSKQKKGIRLMFWSGADFEEEELDVRGGKFKDASIFFEDPKAINDDLLRRCLKKSREIQWDYKNIVKRKGKLVRLEI